MKYRLGAVIIICSMLVACSKEEDQKEVDQEIIEKYIAENNLDAQSTSSGLYYVIEETGSGGNPTTQNEVTVHYRGYLTDGFIFDSSYDRGEKAMFPLSRVIAGWQEGIPLFQKGGKGVLLIPSHLGYGNNPPFGSAIPSNAVLIFDIELFDFQ